LLAALQRRQDADVIFTRATERYVQFRTLIAGPYSVEGLSDELYRGLRRFVERGGTILSVSADWTVSRPDLTQRRDITAEMVGVRYGEAAEGPASIRAGKQEMALLGETPRRAVEPLPGTRVLATFSPGSGPAVTEKPMGEGRVIGVHFDAGAELEQETDPPWLGYFASLVRQATRPAIVAEGEGFRLITTLRKGNWIAVSLFPDQVPSHARLKIDPAALGVAKDRFRMLMLGKQMEITRPGDLWGDSGFWTAEELKSGFRVTVVADNDRNMPLPEQFDLSAFEGERGRRQAEYLDTITRDWWDSPNRGRSKRTYAHEIVVLAPGDEPVMPDQQPEAPLPEPSCRKRVPGHAQSPQNGSEALEHRSEGRSSSR